MIPEKWNKVYLYSSIVERKNNIETGESYSNKVKIDNNLETSVEGLYSIGDGGGLTRGLMMASASGVYLARVLADKIKE